MIKSAGILISYDHPQLHLSKIPLEREYLLCHPTNHAWYGTFSIPKGQTDPSDGGSLLGTALRETREEVGLQFSYKDIINPNDPLVVDYKRGNRVYKKVYVFKVHLLDLSPYQNIFDMETLNIKSEYLQLEEVDWAGFLSVLGVKDKIFHRFTHLIEDPYDEQGIAEKMLKLKGNKNNGQIS